MAGLSEFKNKINEDKAFAAKFEGVKTPEDLVKVAKENGYDFTENDVTNEGKLSENDLDKNLINEPSTILASGYFITC